MVLITALACSAGGYALIHAQFRASLDREVAALYEENFHYTPLFPILLLTFVIYTCKH